MTDVEIRYGPRAAASNGYHVKPLISALAITAILRGSGLLQASAFAREKAVSENALFVMPSLFDI